MVKKPGQKVRGSSSGRPIMVLFDVLGQRWVLRILWELRQTPLNFRELQASCGGISPTSLNVRLKELRELRLVQLGDDGYALTRYGKTLGTRLTKLSSWAEDWAKAIDNGKA